MSDNTEIKDQSKRRAQIALLETIIAKNAAAIHATELCLRQQMEKQINRLAELRLQKMLLNWAEKKNADLAGCRRRYTEAA